MSQFHQDAITAALTGDWRRAHNIVKDYDDPFACWIHAVLHKIEGDADNSRYWYAQTGLTGLCSSGGCQQGTDPTR